MYRRCVSILPFAYFNCHIFLRRVMIDKEKNNARYRLSHCVNVLFSVDHGTFRWRREDKSRGIVYQNTRANGYRFTVWANGKQNSRLANFVLESRSPFAQIKSIFPKKSLRKPATGIKGDFNEMNHEFLFETFGTEKRYLFRNSVAHRSFLIGMTWKVMFHLLSNWIFWKLFVYGKQPQSLPCDMFM